MKIPLALKNLKFCRIRKGTKKPFEKNWTNKHYSYEEISKFKDENYGVHCGINNLGVIDSDNKALQIAVENLLPKTYRIKTGGGGTHSYFFIKDLDQKLILETEDGTHLGEIQWKGQQVIGPGSIHPSGKKYKEINQEPIATISAKLIYDSFKPFIKQLRETEENAKWERKEHSEIDDLSVASIWGTIGLKKHGSEYYGSHPIHGSDSGTNFWINPSKNIWHCFRCNSGGGVLSAIAVKEGIIDCSEAHKGYLRGTKAIEAIEKAKEKYGLITTQTQQTTETTKEETKIIWDSELQNWIEEQKVWIIDRLIPSKSVCVFTGKRGTLKTFVALLMGYSIAAGINFLGHFSTRKGGVIYLDKENGIPIMKERTAMIKKGLELNNEDLKIGFICFSQLKISKKEDISKIEKLIEKHKPALLIVDTYRRGINFDENDAGKVSELFVDILRPIVEKYDISILLIHHDRKGTGKAADEMDEIRGSSDLANYADIILKMERKSGRVILKQLKNRNAAEEKPIKIKCVFDEDCIKMVYEGEFMSQTQTDKCAEAIILWITEEGIDEFKTKDVKEIALKGGFKKNALHSALIELQNTGVIENVGFGTYKSASNG